MLREMLTSRERHQSAPYLRLNKIEKGHESVKTLKVLNSQKTKTTELVRQVLASAGTWCAERGIVSHF